MEYKNISKTNKHKRGEEILQTLSQNVQFEFKKEFFGKILSNYKLFNLNFSQECRDSFCMNMKELILQPGDCIFQQNAYNDNIYFLYNGEVHIFQEINNERRVIGVAKTGDVIGNQSFFTNLPEEVGVMSSGTSQLVYFNRKDFLTVLKQFPKDYESFCRVRDNLIIYNRYYDQVCFSCHQFGHYVLKCPFYDKRRTPLLTIFRYNINIVQQREKKERNCHQKFNTLQRNKFVRKVLREIRWQYAHEVQEELKDIDYNDEQEIMNTSDFLFYMSVPQFKYVENQILMTDEDENDISSEYFREYNAEKMNDDTSTIQNSERRDLSFSHDIDYYGYKNIQLGLDLANKHGNQYNAQEIVLECDNESSDSEYDHQKQNNSTSLIPARTQNVSLMIEKKTPENLDDSHNEQNSSRVINSQSDFMQIRAKAKEADSKIFNKLNSLGLYVKSPAMMSLKTNESVLTQSQFSKQNSLKQYGVLSQSESLEMETKQSQLNNLQSDHQNYSLPSLGQIFYKQSTSASINSNSLAKKPSLMTSLIQQKYNQVQKRRETLESTQHQNQTKDAKVKSTEHIQSFQSVSSQHLNEQVSQFQQQKMNTRTSIKALVNHYESLITLELDRQKDFKGYFPNNNLANVLRLHSKYIQKLENKVEKVKKNKATRIRRNVQKLSIANLINKKEPRVKSPSKQQDELKFITLNIV